MARTLGIDAGVGTSYLPTFSAVAPGEQRIMPYFFGFLVATYHMATRHVFGIMGP